MESQLLDLSFLYSLAENDGRYIYEVINLFLNNVPAGLARLEQFAHEGNDFEAIHRQAHALKSSAGIIKIRGMYDDLVAIEAAAKTDGDKDQIVSRLDSILHNFATALPLIEAERDKNKPVLA